MIHGGPSVCPTVDRLLTCAIFGQMPPCTPRNVHRKHVFSSNQVTVSFKHHITSHHAKYPARKPCTRVYIHRTPRGQYLLVICSVISHLGLKWLFWLICFRDITKPFLNCFWKKLWHPQPQAPARWYKYSRSALFAFWTTEYYTVSTHHAN